MPSWIMQWFSHEARREMRQSFRNQVNRTDEASSQEQLAAISQVLRAIANSPDALQPIFDTILTHAIRLCRADLGVLLLFEGTRFRIAARQGYSNPYTERITFIPLHPSTPLARLVADKRPLHIADLTADESYLGGVPSVLAAVEKIGVRTYLLVPLLRENELVGGLGMLRTKVLPFTDKEIEMVRDFAAEATIALESTCRERKLRELQMELSHVHRLGTMNQLAASIAHEMKQPLSALIMWADSSLRWLGKNPPEVKEAKRSADRIIQDANRAAAVVDRIRALSTKSAYRVEPVNLNDAIREVAALIYNEATKHMIDVKLDLLDGLPQIAGDRVQLQQVVLNLLVNSIEAMSNVSEGDSELRISTQNIGSAVLVAVEDTGIGIDAENLNRLFQPFNTTKPDGMGMGLSISRSIIEAHQGRLWATSRERRGALFQFTIPIAPISTIG